MPCQANFDWQIKKTHTSVKDGDNGDDDSFLWKHCHASYILYRKNENQYKKNWGKIAILLIYLYANHFIVKIKVLVSL